MAITLEAIGDPTRALDLLDQIQILRDPSGAYWTGWQYVNSKHYPNEQSSYTAAAMILAADAMCGATDASSLFRTIAADPSTVASSGDAACGCEPVPRDHETTSPA